MLKPPFGGFKMSTNLNYQDISPDEGKSRVSIPLSGLTILIIIVIVGILVGILLIFEPATKNAEANLVEGEEDKSFSSPFAVAREGEENRFSSSPFAVAREVEIKEISQVLEKGLPLLQENSLLAISSPSNPESQTVKKIRVVITAYSSTIDQTDLDPFVTAAGTWVREGIVANNKYPFGTEIRIPEIYGEKVFVVEDRMSWKKGKYHIDIWFPSYWEALNFGTKRTYIEILES